MYIVIFKWMMNVLRWCPFVHLFDTLFQNTPYGHVACFAVIKYAIFLWIVGFQWLMQIDRYNYLQDYRRPFSSCKSNKEWTYITLTCYNESEKELFYKKRLIVDRLTRARLITLWNVWSWFSWTEFFKRTNHRLQKKGFITYVDPKAIILKGGECINFFKNNSTRTQEPVFLIYHLSLFLPWHFHVWNLYGKQLRTSEANLVD